MQKLAEICIRRPVFASMLILALVVVGAAGYFHLGVDRFPSYDLPTVSVRTTLPGASPEDIETLVAKPIEEAVNTIEGLQSLRSINGPGMSIVVAEFDLKRDIETAAQDVRDKVATKLRDLTRVGADAPIITKADSDSAPILTLAVSGPRSIRELTELSDKIVKVQLERSSGVGQVSIVGGLDRAMNIWVDADRLLARNLPITAVQDAVQRQNADIPAGNVTAESVEQTLRTMGRLADAAAFNDIVIASVNGVPVRLKDVGYAEDGNKEKRSVARLNGQPTVSLEVRRQSGANSVAVIEEVKANLARILPQLPPDVKVEVIRDQSRYIYAALHEIRTHLIAGSILACLVVLAFMRSWRSTVIASMAIPASVIATFGMMWALNFTLNSVTMLALVLMVGIVIDDAIVVLENIFRFVEEKQMGAMEAARRGTAEIGLAVLATTLSLVVIFIPVSFMSSISGRFLYQFGITAAVAVMVSLLVSFTLTPMMSARLLAGDRKAHAKSKVQGVAASRRGLYGLIESAYMFLLRKALKARVVVAILAVGVMLCAIPLYGRVKQEYTPSDVDEGEFNVYIEGPQNASINAMDDVMKSVEKDIMSIRGVQTVLSTSGGSFLGVVNQGSVYVGLVPSDQRIFSIGRLMASILKGDPGAAFRDNFSQRDVMNEIRGKLGRYRSVGLIPRVQNMPSINIGGGGGSDIFFALRGPELDKLVEYSGNLWKKADELGLQDANTSLKLTREELRVQIDRERAADLGVDPQDIGTALRLMVGGDTAVSRFRDESLNEEYDVQLRLIGRDRASAGDVSRLYLPRKGGGQVEMSNLATLTRTNSPSRVDRLDRQRVVYLSSGIKPGYALADRLEALRGEVAKMNLPPEYNVSIAGRGKELENTFHEFLWAFLMSVILMYIILAMNYESVIHPITILLSLPLTLPFALLSLYLTGGTLNLYSALGILVLFGVVKKNAILQIDHMNKLRAAGMEKLAAIYQGNRDRLRPILMTTIALVAGMLPLALGSGPGAEERRAVAIIVIGGQTLSLLLTLLVTPVVYSLLDELRPNQVAGQAKTGEYHPLEAAVG